MSLHYADFYEHNENWLDWLPNPVDAIIQTYPAFFQGMTLNRHTFKAVLLSKKDPLHTKSQDLFKALFKMPKRLIPQKTHQLSFCETLQSVSYRFGHHIIAHGVEEQKGGLYNLLLMCVSSTITVPSQSWGRFIDGMPNISPRGHGPYYIIHSTHPGQHPTNNQSLLTIAYIVVPFKENIDHLSQTIAKMEQFGLIDARQRTHFINKLIDYDAFAHVLTLQTTN